MKRGTWSGSLFCVVLVGGAGCVECLGCAGGDTGGGGGDQSHGPVLSGSPDAGAFVFEDDAASEAGPLLRPCDPSNATSCGPGFVCYAQHTSAAWWVDLYGTCTFDCASDTYALCDSLGGSCGCPVPQGATSANCAVDGGTPMLCVPALRPGASAGANDGEGGCGTPNCGGGPVVGAPVDAAVE